MKGCMKFRSLLRGWCGISRKYPFGIRKEELYCCRKCVKKGDGEKNE